MPVEPLPSPGSAPRPGPQALTAIPVGGTWIAVPGSQIAVPALPLGRGPATTSKAAQSAKVRRPRRDPFRGRRKFFASFGTSAALHCLLVIVAGLVAMHRPHGPARTVLAASLRDPPPPLPQRLPVAALKPQMPRATLPSTTPQELAARLVEQQTAGRRGLKAARLPKRPEFNPGELGQDELLTAVGGTPYGMLDGRDGELKRALLGDATDESERAVYAGLKWLAAHQRDDGSWHFDHLNGGCRYCTHPGTHGSTTAATGLALLPFLGAGHTHKKDGEFQETVRKGLAFLRSRTLITPLGGDLQDGVNLYSQGIASLALGEAYAMTRDRELYATCGEAMKFIVSAQDKKGGGWRYFPGQVGDTTVTGWMLMALKSAQLGYLAVPPEAWSGARRFLDSVQDDDGAAYGYQGPSRDEPTMTAIGLLCRMYDGWPRGRSSLARGVRTLAKRGPSQTDLYYDYYATQVLRHYGGHEWQAWNLAMREHLVRSQERRGHENGSWYFADKHGDQGGRLYNTAMSLLILEVYYRYLPIYGDRATDGVR